MRNDEAADSGPTRGFTLFSSTLDRAQILERVSRRPTVQTIRELE